MPTNSTMEIMDEFLEKSREYAITSASTGSVSFICSSTIVCILLRSHEGLSSTYHRLLLGMCVGDMISSSNYIMSTAMAPKDVDYKVWNARGNEASCDAQGFIAIFGIFVTSGYNCSLCLFYLAVVKFDKKDRYIRTKLEPWMHVVPVAIALAAAIAGLVSQVYNPGLVNCFVSKYNPPHCVGVKEGEIPYGYEIPCGRGSHNYDAFYYILLVKNLAILPGIIFGSMIMMYREVLKTEKKMGKYGVGALRLRNAPGLTTSCPYEEDSETVRSSFSSRLSSLRSKLPSFNSFRRSTGQASIPSRSNNTNKNTRSVMYRALAYTMAFLATYVFPVIIKIEILVNKGGAFQFRVQLYLAFFFHPLQGLFNFMVFIYPRVITAKRSQRSWFRAFIHALVSRGKKVKEKRVPSKRRLRSKKSRKTSKTVNKTKTTSEKRKNRKSYGEVEEEEKREIEEGPLLYSLPRKGHKAPQKR